MKKASLLLFLVSVMIGCEAPIDLELDESQTNILVVEALLRDQVVDSSMHQTIKLTRTTSYYSNEDEIIESGAIVILEDENGVQTLLPESNNVDSLGYYLLPKDYLFTDNETYTLKITADGETYEASSQYNIAPAVEEFYVFINDVQFLFATPQTPIAPEDTIYDIFIGFEDSPEQGDHYLVNYYVNGKLASVNPRQKQIFPDEGMNGYVATPVLQFDAEMAEYGDMLTVELSTASEDLFNFYTIMFTQTDLSGNPFAGSPPANVPTNFSNGARGIFQVVSSSYYTTPFFRLEYP